jgi:adenylate cyclase
MLAVPGYSTKGSPLIPAAMRPSSAETTCATMLFADLHGYDVLVEQLSPANVVLLLREFFALLTSAVLERGGQIFQIAEADMLAGFGVGDSRHTQIHETLHAARAIQHRFAPIRTCWQRQYSINAGIGIGIHRGEVAIGIFGPGEHEALTLVGDAVNVVAQLCRRARAGEVLLSAAVHLPPKVTGDASEPELLHLPGLRLHGRSAPLDVWCAAAAVRLQMHRPAGSLPNH